MLLLLALACEPTTIKLDDTASGTNETGSTNTDTSQTDSGNTTTDTTDTKTQAQPISYSGTVSGSITMGPNGEVMTCEGEFSAEVSTTGDVTGTATCTDGGRFAFEGDLSGTVSNESVNALWTVQVQQGFSVDLELSGTADKKKWETDIADPNGFFSGIMSGKSQ